MKEKLGNFLEVFGIVLGIGGIAAFVILLLNNLIVPGIFALAAGIVTFVFSLALSQILFSLNIIEEETETMSKRMEVLEVLNREAVSKDLFSSSPKKNVNIPKKRTQSDKAGSSDGRGQGKASCYKCGYTGQFNGSNMCPKCGNHSFYPD